MSLLIELPSRNAVRAGSLYHKPSAINALLAKSVRLVVHEFIHEGESTFSTAGSCTLISFRRQAFVVTTRHQLHIKKGALATDDHLKTIRFSTSDGERLQNILVDRYFFEERNPDQEYHELVFFRVEKEWLEKSADRSYFYPLEPFSEAERGITYFYGYPVSKSEFQYQPLHAFLRVAYFDGKLNHSFRSHSEFVRQYSYSKPGYEANGFSGGAAFSLIGDIDIGWSMVLDGIIVLGSGGVLHIVDANYLIRALDAF